MDRLRDRRSRRDPALTGWLRGPRGLARRHAPRTLRATRPGWCFIAIVFGVGFAALNTGNNLLYLVFALMLAFLVLSGILSESSLRGIAVERHLPRELFAGAANPVVLRIANRKSRVAAFAICVEDRTASPAAAGDAEDDEGPGIAGRCFVLRVGPAASVERSYALTPRRRGDLTLSGLRVSTRFPFGLFVKSVELADSQALLVYPAITPLASQQRARSSRATTEEARAGRSTAGDSISGLREFVQGDAAARVHWRRSLKSGRLVVGERDGETAAEVEILLPLGPELSESAIEERVARAASEVVHHLDAGHRVGLRTRALRFAPASGASHRRELLTFLARVGPDTGGSASATPTPDASAVPAAPTRAEERA